MAKIITDRIYLKECCDSTVLLDYIFLDMNLGVLRRVKRTLYTIT